ncbi:MAG: helix-turn-helix domain-containing protein [Actinomycetota bacterium]|nr:helix-turn-helix domain-containing protein [Actinomycetota bacterium]
MDRRTEILDAALGLMATEGASGTSMRAVAGVCGVNVATLYHYFPSKRELLRAAVAYRQGGDDLFAPPFPEGLPGSVADRLGALLDHIFVALLSDDAFWRSVLAEAIHGDEDVLEPLLEMSNAFEAVLADWIRGLIPDAPALHDPAVVRTIRHSLYGVLVEYLPQADNPRAALAERAREIASVFARLEER